MPKIYYYICDTCGSLLAPKDESGANQAKCSACGCVERFVGGDHKKRELVTAGMKPKAEEEAAEAPKKEEAKA